MKLVSFTAPDGSTVRVNPGQVTDIRTVPPGVYAPDARAIITLGGGVQAVRETPEEIAQLLEAS